MLKNYKILISVVAIALMALLPWKSFAAEINLEAQSPTLSAGDQFEARVTLNAQKQDINAISGRIVFPNLQMKILDIKDGSSLVSLWVEEPHKDPRRPEIAFSGIIPGGYSQDGGLIFSVVFQMLNVAPGTGSVTIKDPLVLLNDGRGTPAVTTANNFDYQIVKQDPSAKKTATLTKDTEAPETFIPAIGREESVFGDKWFLAFDTTDKSSGINHYAVREGWGFYHTATSPYLINDQDLDENIWVKAIDNQGNVRVAFLAATNKKSFFEKYWIYAIVLVLILLAGQYYRNKKTTKK